MKTSGKRLFGITAAQIIAKSGARLESNGLLRMVHFEDSILEVKMSTEKYESVETLKSVLRWNWERIPKDYIRAACNDFIGRLDVIIRNKGNHIGQ